MSPPSYYTRCLTSTQARFNVLEAAQHLRAQILHKSSKHFREISSPPKPSSASTAMVTSPTSSSASDHNTSDAAPTATRGNGRKSRVSAEHTLNRVRENQRRHRARQRDHVASLEQKLAETEKLLEEARAEIAALKAGGCAMGSHQQPQRQNTSNNDVNEGARCIGEGNAPTSQDIPRPPVPALPDQQTDSLALTSIQPDQLIDPQLDSYPDVHGHVPDMSDLSFLGGSSFYLPSPSTSSQSNMSLVSPTSISTPTSTQAPSLDTHLTVTNTTTLTITGPPPCCNDPPTPNSPPPTNTLECTSCSTKPPPSPSESTTLCAQAFVMIGQQNFRNLDPDTIRLWLAQGLRRAQREGEGCRVENGALLRLLDFISGL
ncbi:hypothetical protein J4E86_001044 [Alternaria arbusti]|uniref:uncharacterized protein n=1 Tax=Alternaria arbusti TaxID=232088 RepID=UPI00221FD8AB|nr:uncharacterized protein J4E86_001044 [Alternaria arbusti]KAI4962014.1 hypothetical protein J4E86_001044 [Alternaria arbusti]